MGERFGEYELIKKIATGGMAEIHLARIGGVEGFSRRVVVKRMLPQLAVRPDFVEMFLDEARLAANLAHPNIVQVFNLGQVDGTYFMAMELIDGPHLGALFAHSLRQRRPLPIELCVYTVARAADGLHYAHEQRDPSTGQALNIVHRDISPQNILVSRHGDVKVTDFGVAKAETQQSKTRTGIIKGKVSYMSPEQCLGEPVDRRTDVFALGVVLYELLTRRRLYREKSDLLIMQRITSEELKPPSSLNPAVDPELDRIATTALAKAREDRYATTADLSEALDVWLATQGHADCRAQLQRWMEAHADGLGIGTVETSTGSSATGTPSWEKSGAEAAAAALEGGEEGTVSTPALEPARDPLSGKHPAVTADDLRISPSQIEHTLIEGAPSADGPVLAHETLVLPAPSTSELEESVASTGSHEVELPAEALGRSAPRRPMAALVGGAMALGLLIVSLGLFAASDGEEAQDASDVVTVEAAVRPSEPSASPAAPAEDTAAPADAAASEEGAEGAADKPILRVETVPPGVLVVIDGKPQEDSPLERALDKAPGDIVEVRAVFADQPPVSEKVRLSAGQNSIRLLAKVKTRVVSEPAGAQVFVGDANVGFTPREELFLTPGEKVTIAVVKPGYKRWTRQLTPKAGQHLDIEATLERVPERREPVRTPPPPPQAQAYGSLQVSSKPWGIVYVDGRRVGPTPVLVPKVRAGNRKVRIVNNDEGFGFSKTTTVEVRKNQQSNVGFVFEKKGAGYELVRLVQ